MCCIFGRQVFLKYFHVEQLNIAVSEFARRVAACQKYVRGFTARLRYATMKRTARKCEEDMRQLNDIASQLAHCLTPEQQKYKDEDVKRHEDQLRRAEEEKRKADENRKLEEKKAKHEQKENKVWSIAQSVSL